MASLASQAPETGDLRQQLERVRKLATAGETEEAIRLCESLTAASPESAALRLNPVLVPFKAGRYQQAAPQSRAAPGHTRGRRLDDLGRPLEAAVE